MAKWSGASWVRADDHNMQYTDKTRLSPAGMIFSETVLRILRGRSSGGGVVRGTNDGAANISSGIDGTL